MNIDIKVGYLVNDADLFPTRNGGVKLSFRLRVPRDGLPPKTAKPRNADYFEVVAFGEGWLNIYERLKRGARVFVKGHTQSRDLEDGRVVVETVAQEIRVLEDAPAEAPGEGHGGEND